MLYEVITERNGAKVAYSGTRDLRSSFEKDRLRMTFTLLLKTPLDRITSYNVCYTKLLR